MDRFAKYKWLTGYMTYARLLIPELVQESKVLYLDADLIVKTDVGVLFDTDLNNYPIGAVSWNTVGQSNDRHFLPLLGIGKETDYFNAGILLMDLEYFRRNKIKDRCLAFADKHQGALPSADQSILNFVFNENFYQLARKYNTVVNTTRKKLPEEVVADRIVHLVGFPKPWSFLGEFFHPNSYLSQRYLDVTAFKGYKSYNTLSRGKFYLFFRKIKSYLKCIKARI